MEKEKGKYTETNLLKVDGEGKNKEEICLTYIKLIKEGFSLTVEEVADYLRCSYQYVIKKVVPEVKHIRITEVGKMLLFRYAIDNNVDPVISSLFTKRILFHKEDFKRYICESAEMIVSYKRFYENDFDSAAMQEIKDKLAIFNSKNNRKQLSLNDFMQIVMNRFLWKWFKNEPVTVKTIKSFPTKLLSQNDLMEHFQFSYKIEMYRKLESLGMNKIKIDNMVRYQQSDLEEKFVAKMYITAFLNLKRIHGYEYIKVIQTKALELLD